MLTSVKRGRVVDVGGDEGRLGLSAHRVIPHPPDATLEEEGEGRGDGAQGHDWLTGLTGGGGLLGGCSAGEGVWPAESNLSVGRGSAALAAGVAAVRAQCRTLHRVGRAGRGGYAAGREAQAAAVVLLALQQQEPIST